MTPPCSMSSASTAARRFPAPTAIEREICRSYGLAVVGRTAAVRERYYAISAERRLKHPGVSLSTAPPGPKCSAEHQLRAPSPTVGRP